MSPNQSNSTGRNHRSLLILFFLTFFPVTTFSGFACLNNPCIHGVCLDDLNTSYSCYCIDGYTGVNCQTNWDECWSSPCTNGGTCVDGVASFNCTCPPGFVGEFCEENFNECDSNPCLNNGTCYDVTDGYNCSCPPGYLGDHCEVDVAVCNASEVSRCSNGGVCVEGPGLTFTCRCRPGWEGFFCESEIDECRSSPCLNGAVCVDMVGGYACACLFGFTGKDCEEVVKVCEDNPCKNSALCLMEAGRAECYCVPDYHGEYCQFQYDECQLGPRCLNGGTCVDGVDDFSCSCPPRLTGIFCECLILEDEELDCSYVSPRTTAITFETTKLLMSTVETTEFITTTVPNTTIAATSKATLPEESTSTVISITTSEDFTTLPPKTSTYQETTTIKELTTTENSTEFGTTTILPYETVFTLTPSVSTSTVTTISTSTVFEQPTPTTIEQTVAPNTTIEIARTEPTKTTILPSLTTFLTDQPEPTTSTIETTTLMKSTINPPIFEDCTKSGQTCQNGGSCVLTNEGHQCVCPYDAEGQFCEVRLGVKIAAFSGDSYLSHRLDNITNVLVEFKTKTLSPNGVLFYANIERTYVALYLEGGFLRFKFSCGFQTMLLSELDVPVNNGHEMTIKVMLEFRKDRKHCDASINLNDTAKMAGDQIAVMEQLIKPIGWIHFGSIPHEQIRADLNGYGFMGCIWGLKISNKKVHIFKNAEDGFSITECSSLVCLSSPCANGGSCASDGGSWRCHCKNGFLGKTCELSVCENNPCLYGGTCMPFTASGYICLCPFGKHGHFCENDLEITEPSFSSSVHGLSSFAAYPIPSGISSNMELKFRFIPTTMDQISILMFIGQKGYHDSFSDHMAVSFVKGYIMLTWNLGSGPRRIFTSQPIKKDRKSYLVRLGHLGRRAWLFVEDLGNVTGRSPGNLIQLDVFPLLYLGGHESLNFSTLPHDLPLHVGFSGCIYDVQLKSGSVVMPLQVTKQVTGRSVGQCDTSECYEGVCHNGGACVHHGSTFMCLCQDGWFGPLCSDKNNPCDSSLNGCAEGSTCFPLLSGYECDCPLGKTGKYCEIEEKITDVSFSGRRSYISLGSIELNPNNFNFILDIRPLSNRGLVLFIGKETSFISLALHNGLLELTVLTAKKKNQAETDIVTIRSNKLLALGLWYKTQFGAYGRRLYLIIDNLLSTSTIPSGATLSISPQTLYLGGIPDLSLLPVQSTPSQPIPFAGCARNLYLDNNRLELTSEGNIRSARNVGDCDGTPCGGDYCLNNGSCWLDLEVRPRCSCPEPYLGERCQEAPDCGTKGCLNGGRCRDGRCVCRVGWSGAFCERSLGVGAPQFGENGYLVVRSGGEKRRDIRKAAVAGVMVNFTTAEKDGLLLWTTKDNIFLGVGLEKGFLKFIHFTPKSNETTVELVNVGNVSDGLWHNLTVTFRPLVVYVDDKLVLVKKKKQPFEAVEFFPGNEFYLGGLPSWMKNNVGMIFNGNLKGCIESLSFGSDRNVIRDFSKFEGENVGVCRFLNV